MEERTADEIAAIFSDAGDSVTLINTDTVKADNETLDEWKGRIKHNTEHLEINKAYKKNDGTTSIWGSESFTAIDAAIVTGKKVYE